MEHHKFLIKIMSNGELVSICIPAYKQGSYIKETVLSCLNQTYSNIEVVVVDDCSKDQTESILLAIAKVDPRLRYSVNDHNVGLQANWNLVLAQAKGSYIKVVCGDDLIDARCIELQLSAFRENPALSMVSCNRHIIDSQSAQLFNPKRSHFLRPTFINEGLVQVIRSGTNLIGEPMCGLFRRGEFQFRAEFPYMIDLDFWFQVWKTGPIQILQEPLASFRVHPGSLLSNLGRKQFLDFRNFCFQLQSHCPQLITPTDVRIGLFKSRLRAILRDIYLRFHNQ